QRVCIARAIAPRPALLIGDEPVSALDVSVQARILKLLAKLLANGENGLRAMLLVTHDLAVVATICDYAYVLDAGRVVEEGEPRGIFNAPRHPATRRLLAAGI
ncbi:MAG: peptide ABC transporter substrate-binding protein, partial [Kiritimatiellae bacterium]|nr:peptide ABC transporter substrate-binding protein [Kiritimatiellia bacterium]